MPVCAVKLCHNHAGKRDNETKITFHRFPTDPVLSDRWTVVIQKTRGEEFWKPHKSSVVCSVHFTEEDIYFTKNGLRRRLNNKAVPSKCLFLPDMDKEESTNKEKEPPVSTLKINVHADVRPSCSKETENRSSPATVLQDFPDLDWVFDSPDKAKLRKKLCHKIKQELKHRAIISSLRKKNTRLKKKNASLKYIINTLKQQKYINEYVQNALKGNLFAAALYSQMTKTLKDKG